jgi:hypothetical protein
MWPNEAGVEDEDLDDLDDLDGEGEDEDEDEDKPADKAPDKAADKAPDKAADKAPDKAADKADDSEPASAWTIRTELMNAILGDEPKRASFKNDSEYVGAIEARREHKDWIRGVADALTKPTVYKGVTIPPLSASEQTKVIEDAKQIIQNISPERMAVLLRIDAALRSAKAEGAKTVAPAAAAPERPKAEKTSASKANKPRPQAKDKDKIGMNDHEARARMMFGPRFDKPLDPR